MQVKSKPHSVHDLSNDYKSSINFGGLYPTYVEDTLPADKYLHLSSEVFLRFAPLKFPIMHRCKVRTNYFCVPYRILMGDKNYQKWHSKQVDIPDLILTFAGKNFNFKNTIFDYLGRDVNGLNAQLQASPAGEVPSVNLGNPLDYLGYLDTWRCWYADEQLDSDYITRIDGLIESFQAAMTDGLSSFSTPFYGPSLALLGGDGVLPVSYSKDYFTAAQPQPQRGGDVFLMSPLTLDRVTGPLPASSQSLLVAGSSTINPGVVYDSSGGVGYPLRATDTIRDLWQKEQFQRFEDLDALFGTDNNEYLAGHWGVVSSDARLQMPQFIGGGQQIVQIQEVTQTSADTEDSPLGALAGKGTSLGRTRGYRYFSEEHSFVYGFTSVVPDNGYMTGNPRYVYKKNILDFADPVFNNIGYQPVYKGEIYADGTSAEKEEFGYQPRHSEYRWHRSIATGDFRDSTLMAWHLNRSFDEVPPLNSEFIHVNLQDSARIFNNTDPDAQHIYLDVYNRVSLYRTVNYMPSSLHI